MNFTLFTDPANGDYTLRPDAPVYAFSPEWEPLPVAQMGRVSEEAPLSRRRQA